ncbi:hypothetical protein Tsubulata_033828 [Turnera subulata]|uniref:KIB1-4 beta-propeller domain-containing protein n=1 Tax=Turnera subulata TaxID=218843 RepID=A0A9Q0FRW4_9ROSI|nr:hypothetical protein Tsubulata_033828 [Turnera subulata]
MDSRDEPRWCALASDLIRKISGHLDTQCDIRRFRSVCRSWRSSTLPLPPKTTTSVLHLPGFDLGEDDNNTNNSHCTLTESTVYCIEPLSKPNTATAAADHPGSNTNTTPCWVVRVQFSESGTVIFKDLASPYPIRAADAQLLPKELDLRDYEVREICNAYHLSYEGFSISRATRVAVSSCFSDIGEGFMVMVLKKYGGLAIWRFGDDRWTNIELTPWEDFPFHSIAYHKGKFYAVDEAGGTISVDPVSLEIHQVVHPMHPSHCDKYLVQAFGDLFLVDYSCFAPGDLQFGHLGFEDLHFGFEVRKLEEERHEWVEEEDGLNDRVLFVTHDWLALVSARDLPGYKGHCVYFVHRLFNSSSCNHPGSRLMVLDAGSVRCLCRNPHCSKLFWPPPTWLQKNPAIGPNRSSSNCISWRVILLVLVAIAAIWLAHAAD